MKWLMLRIAFCSEYSVIHLHLQYSVSGKMVSWVQHLPCIWKKKKQVCCSVSAVSVDRPIHKKIVWQCVLCWKIDSLSCKGIVLRDFSAVLNPVARSSSGAVKEAMRLPDQIGLNGYWRSHRKVAVRHLFFVLVVLLSSPTPCGHTHTNTHTQMRRHTHTHIQYTPLAASHLVKLV